MTSPDPSDHGLVAVSGPTHGAEAGGDPTAAAVADASRRRGRIGTVTVVVGLVGATAVALARLRSPHWYANLDLALTEMRIRDVGSRHPPLVGLSGRIEADGVAGSHPGPLSFWVLAPLYRLYGSTSWAMQAATATLNLAAVGTATWLGHRRGGRTGALAAVAGMAVLLHAYGADRWTQAWNPYLPLLWWPVVLLAVWSVLCDDLVALPVVVAAGSLCLQTHVSYLGLVPGLGLLAAGGGCAVVLRRRRGAPTGPGHPGRWCAASAALLVLLWVPPIVEQVRGDPGNLTIVREQFAHPSEPSVGAVEAVRTVVGRLDPLPLLAGAIDRTGSLVVGAVVLAAWLASAAVAWCRRLPRRVRALHLVVASALALGLVSISRIQGTLIDHLVLWSWGTTVLAIGALAVTVMTVADPALVRRRLAPVLGLVAAVAIVAVAVDAARVEPPQPGQARIHAALLPEAMTALERGRTADGQPVPGGGPRARYLVRSDDTFSGGLNSYTVLLELERHGLDAGVDPAFAVSVRPFRVLDEADATAVVTYVAGPAVDEWRRRPDAVEIAHVEPAAADVHEADRLRERATADLERHGLDDLVDDLDGNLLALGLDPRIPAPTVATLRHLIALSGPTSIFVSPSPR